MPTYTFKNKKTGIVYEDFMSISDMMKLRENPNIEIVIDSVNIVSGQGDNIDSKTDAGWKETLAKISEAHPDSELNKQYGKRRSKRYIIWRHWKQSSRRNDTDIYWLNMETNRHIWHMGKKYSSRKQLTISTIINRYICSSIFKLSRI